MLWLSSQPSRHSRSRPRKRSWIVPLHRRHCLSPRTHALTICLDCETVVLGFSGGRPSMSLGRVRLILICGLTAVCAPALAQNPPAKPAPAPARPAPAPVVARPAPAPVVARPAPAPVVAKPVTTPVVAKPATAAVVAKPTTASVASKPPTAAQQLQYANQGAAQRNHTFDGTKAPAGPVTANTAPKPSVVGAPVYSTPGNPGFKPAQPSLHTNPPPAPKTN
jgi:hypothetical protein